MVAVDVPGAGGGVVGTEMVAVDVPGGGLVLGGGWERRVPHTAVALSGAREALPHVAKAAAKAVSPARRLSPRQPSPVVIEAPATGDELQVWPRNAPKGIPLGDARPGIGAHSPADPVRV
jgi:hypothetical protein